MTIATPPNFVPQTTAQLRKLRAEKIEQIKPDTVEQLRFLRSVDELDADREEALDFIEALDYVIGD